MGVTANAALIAAIYGQLWKKFYKFYDMHTWHLILYK